MLGSWERYRLSEIESPFLDPPEPTLRRVFYSPALLVRNISGASRTGDPDPGLAQSCACHKRGARRRERREQSRSTDGGANHNGFAMAARRSYAFAMNSKAPRRYLFYNLLCRVLRLSVPGGEEFRYFVWIEGLWATEPRLFPWKICPHCGLNERWW